MIITTNNKINAIRNIQLRGNHIKRKPFKGLIGVKTSTPNNMIKTINPTKKAQRTKFCTSLFFFLFSLSENIFALNRAIDNNSCPAPKGHIYPQNTLPKSKDIPKIKKVNPVKNITFGKPPKRIPPQKKEIDNKIILTFLVILFLYIKMAADNPTRNITRIARPANNSFPK